MKEIKTFEWFVHLAVVVLGLLILNYPSFDLTFGVFNSGNGSLLWPSVLGTVFNLALFYGIAFYLIPITLKKGTGMFVIRLIVLFAFISTVEIFIDAILYRSNGNSIESDVWSELILMVVITHVFVMIVAFAYRFSKDWFANAKMNLKKHDDSLNYFKEHASQSLRVWQKKGWINKDDPRGWFQWYCRYFIGRRCEDDARQIKRWKGIRRHIAAIKKNCRKKDQK